jgi:acetyl-CoA C-acetyltransferase
LTSNVIPSNCSENVFSRPVPSDRKLMKTAIIDAIRTPRGKGKAGGALDGIRAADLLADLCRALSERQPGIEHHLDDTLFGCVTQVGDQGSNIGKVALMRAGWPATVPGATINRFCASGLSAVNIMAAQAEVADGITLGGGVEMMSRTPMFGDNGVMRGSSGSGRRSCGNPTRDKPR